MQEFKEIDCFGDNGVLGVLGIIASIGISFWIGKIAKDNKRISADNAKYAKEMADSTKEAILEANRANLRLSISRSYQMIPYDRLKKYDYFFFTLWNTGTRSCQDIEVKITPDIQTEQYIDEINGEIIDLKIEDRKIDWFNKPSVSFLNSRSQIYIGYKYCINFIPKEAANSIYTFEINYKDIFGEQQKPIVIKSKILDLDQQYIG